MLKLLKTLSILLVLIAMDEISLFSLNYPSISQWIWRFSVVRNKRSIDSLYLRFFLRQRRFVPRCADVSKLLSSFSFWHSTRSQSQLEMSEKEIAVSSGDGDLSLCSQCWTAYDSEEHQPKLLKCQSHPLATICLKCLHVSLFSSPKVHQSPK